MSVPDGQRSPRQGVPPAGSARVATLALTVSPLLWVPQAGFLAWAIAQLQRGDSLQALLPAACGFLLLGFLRAGLEAWGATGTHDSARRLLGKWREQIISTVAARSPLDKNRLPAGAAASILAEQAEATLPWMTRYRTASLRARWVPLMILLPVGWFSWLAALILLVAAPLIPIFMAIVGWQARAASQQQWLRLGDINGFLLDRLRGLATLRALGAVQRTAGRLRAIADDLRLRTMRVLRIAFLSSAVLELFSALGVALVAVYVGFHLLGQIDVGTWGGKLTLAEALFVLLLAPAFFEPLRELAAVWHDKAAGEAAEDALSRLGENGVPFPGASAGQHEQPERVRATEGAAVILRGVDLAFPGESTRSNVISLDISPGEKIAIKGESGSGKTHLLALIAGLVPVVAGDIFIDDVRLCEETATSLRRDVAWMGQQPHIFAGSVEGNVRLDRPHISAAQARQAMTVAQLAKVAAAHPSLALGEGGDGLSGGEGARVALARLVAQKDARVWLLDEPTAHLDAETADLIRHALLEYSGTRTVIVATHDPALMAAMDRVISIDVVPAGGVS